MTIKNDGRPVSLPDEANGKVVHLPYKGQVGEVKLSLGFGAQCINRVRVHSDLSLEFSGCAQGDPMEESACRALLAQIGLQLELDDPASRIKPLRGSGWDTWRDLSEMIGGQGSWKTEGDLVFHVVSGNRSWEVGPFSRREAEKMFNGLLSEARSWIHEMFPTLRRLHLAPADAVELYQRGRRADIVRVKVGQIVNLTKAGSSYFGSGGGYGVWVTFGCEPKVEVVLETDDGFARDETVRITFPSPGAVYTAAGDGINGGRVFFGNSSSPSEAMSS